MFPPIQVNVIAAIINNLNIYVKIRQFIIYKEPVLPLIIVNIEK